jgi:hypothetical protein
MTDQQLLENDNRDNVSSNIDFMPKIYYKITNEKENHNNYQYTYGINILDKEFEKEGSCVKGGLYFTNIQNIHHFFKYGCYIREIRIPTSAEFIKDPESEKTGVKYRSNILYLGKRYDMYSIEALSLFPNELLSDILEELFDKLYTNYDNTIQNSLQNTLNNAKFVINQISDIEQLNRWLINLTGKDYDNNGIIKTKIADLLVVKGSNNSMVALNFALINQSEKMTDYLLTIISDDIIPIINKKRLKEKLKEKEKEEDKYQIYLYKKLNNLNVEIKKLYEKLYKPTLIEFYTITKNDISNDINRLNNEITTVELLIKENNDDDNDDNSTDDDNDDNSTDDDNDDDCGVRLLSQCRQIHNKVLDKIIKLLKLNKDKPEDIEQAKNYKAIMWSQVIKNKNFKSNLDKSVELEWITTLANLKKIDSTKV